jgi:hypothetical protein
MSMCQISIMLTHLTRSHRFPSARMEVQQDVTMRDMLNLVDSEDAWEVAEMSGTCIAAQQDVAVCADSEDGREVAEMSGSRPVTTRVKYRTSGHTSCAGIHLSFPPGRNEYTPYTFGLHPQPPVPWNYHHQRHVCPSSKDLSGALGYCLRKNLHLLSRDNTELLYEGIIGRIESGIHALESICCRT